MRNDLRLEGIHHISAITGDAARNVDFYTRVLGLRLVAKTVNQDDPSVYHLFYADENGQPGAEMTFFEYPLAKPGRPGAGMVHTIVWRAGSDAALDFWAERTGGERTATSARFEDPEGLRHKVVVADGRDEPLIAGHPEIPREFALQGFEGVRAYANDPRQSAIVLERLLGATQIEDAKWELRGKRRGGWIAYDEAPDEPGRQSAGIVHHVAFGTSQAEHPAWMEHLDAAGVPSSGVVDRHYFHSIYFREPSGVLFEIADDGPGFTVDVPLERLGEVIILPPKFEPYREQIEARLTPLPDPRADRIKESA